MRPKKAQEIAEIVEKPQEVQKGYLAGWLLACTFPHRDPKTSSYTRTNGECSLSIQTGLDIKGREIGLPYGSLVRLLMFWIITEANRLKWAGENSRRIELGDSMNRFVQAVGLNPDTGRGKRGDATRLREQMRRLFRCHISFTRTLTAPNGAKGVSWIDMKVAPKGEWWGLKKPDLSDDPADFKDSWIELGEDFFHAVTTNPVPIDFRAICALKHSPMAMDLYSWLTWRVYGMKDGQEAKIPLHGPDGLAEQLGSQYTRTRDFKAALAENMEAVKEIWPQLDYDLSASRLTIRKSPVPIPKISRVKKRRRFGEVKPDELAVDTLVWLRVQHPKANHSAIWRAYRAFLRREKITPQDIDAHFKDYAEKWIRGEF